MKNRFISKNPEQTKKRGELLSREILKGKTKRRAFVLGLEGDLGGGKTTFLQGFARGLGIEQRITSPTFILMRKFQIPKSEFQTFYHIDCYRIEKPKEILDLGFEDIIAGPKNIVAIEWADKIKKTLPKGILILKFEFINKTTRKILSKCL